METTQTEPEPLSSETHPKSQTTRPRQLIFILALSVLIAALTFLGLLHFYSQPPADDAIKRVEIETGQSVRSITETLAQHGVVRSELLLYAILNYRYDSTKIFAGTYVFSGTETVYDVAHKLASQDTDDDYVRVTIPEGLRLTQVAKLVADDLPAFDSATYLSMTDGKEGYLWPETYFVPDNFTAADLITLQEATYEENVAPLRDTMGAQNLTEADVVTLASILEREANDETSMKMVAGILRNRLAIDMPLQADATIEYVLDTPLNELPPGALAEELRQTDSPYNTYNQIGLPPTPIGNPGLTAITAVLEPTPSDYFYYITDESGEFYYAKTYQEHLRNIELYLRS